MEKHIAVVWVGEIAEVLTVYHPKFEGRDFESFWEKAKASVKATKKWAKESVTCEDRMLLTLRIISKLADKGWSIVPVNFTVVDGEYRY